MRKPFRVGGVAVGALAVALTAGAFAFAPAAAAAPTVASSTVPGSIRPGTPLKAVGAGARAAASAATAATSVTNLQAVNWAGYASSLGTTTFRFVSAHFTVPPLDCTGVTAPNGAWAAHWVGLDGFRSTSSTVEQTGVVEACNGTTPQYAAFWEMFPNAPGYPSITVTPGDTISMSVYYNRSTRKFSLTFSDTTSGHSFTRTRACPAGATCRRNSAEVISEAPFDATTSSVLPLADFTSASFANVAITNTSGTHRGGLQSSFWNTYKFTQVSDGTNTTVAGDTIPQGTVLDSPSALSQKTAFTDTWEAANG
jgi:Peptidase A4 family